MAAKSKTSNKQDLNAMSAEEILNNLQDAELRLKKMMFSHAITPIDNPMGIRTLRREIARMKTAQTRKKLGF
ncbi:MAG: 50S ribosomal protein L29 [Chitinophagaceae bacterium]|nr:50S ribosomal protein L29 [Chitinophagaceae bacterium]